MSNGLLFLLIFAALTALDRSTVYLLKRRARQNREARERVEASQNPHG
jgi:hypothetical protein